VKHLNLKIINLFIIMMLFFSFKGVSQNTQTATGDIMGTINASGNDAAGSSGTVAYSIGQVFYTYIGLSVYNVAQGVQHDEINNTLKVPENSVEPKLEIFVFPNPTTDFVNINMEGFEYESKSYQFYDLQGRLLKQNIINQAETQIGLSDLRSAVYILQVYVNNKIFKTFKILKK
jgi:hypothetical protein